MHAPVPLTSTLAGVAGLALVMALAPSGPASAGVVPAAVPVDGRTDCAVRTTQADGAFTYLHFTDPSDPCVPDAGGDANIRNELARLIRAATFGSEIRGNIYANGNDQPMVLEALQQVAVEKNVTVRLTYRSAGAPKVTTSNHYAADALRLLRNGKRAKACTNACIARTGGAHTKMFTFSSTTAPDGTTAPAVWANSSNLVNGGGGNQDFNNSETIYGDASLYAFSRGVLKDMWAQKKTTDYYKGDRGRYVKDGTGSHVSMYVSPEARTDLVLDRLKVYSASAGCQLTIVQSIVEASQRKSLVKKVLDWARAGCAVRLVANSKHLSATEEKAFLHVNREASAKGSVAVYITPRVHDKLVLLKMRPAGSSTFEYRVYGGSHNWNALSKHQDDIFVRFGAEAIDEGKHPFYDAFATHVGAIIGVSKRCTWTATLTCTAVVG